MKLSQKQRVFVQEYLVDLNASKAAVRAGYSKKTAFRIGAENMQKPAIKSAIQEYMEQREARTQIAADTVVIELAKIGFANMQDYFKEGFSIRDIQALPREHAAAIQEVTIDETVTDDGVTVRRVKFKLLDKRAALVELGKHLGIFEANNRQKNPADAIAAVIAEIQANSKRGLPCEDKRQAAA